MTQSALSTDATLQKLQRDSFSYFLHETNAANGLVKDKTATHCPASIATAGIAEMLLQSHAGELHLLPALPGTWPSGTVQGLRARGGFAVDIAWENGRLTQAQVHSSLGNQCRLRSGHTLHVIGRDEISVTALSGTSVIQFSTQPGESYTLKPFG